MAADSIYRTSTFVLSDEDYGTAHIYRTGTDFREEWRTLVRRWRRKKGESKWSLPTSSLETALRLLTGGFANIDPRFDGSEDSYLLVSDEPVEPKTIRRALRAWEEAVLEDDALGQLHEEAGDLQRQEVDVSDFVNAQAGACPKPPTWVWDAAYWRVAKRLSRRPLHHDAGALDLRIDSEANLIGWDRPIRSKAPRREALLYVQPQLITIPGLPDRLALQLRPSVSRLAPSWWNVGKIRTAWVEYRSDRPLSRVEVHQRNGGAVWDDRLPSVLRRCELDGFPEPSDVDLSESKRVRARLVSPPRGFPIGSGPGQPLHDAVSIWARAGLFAPEPVELEKSEHSIRRPDSAGTVPVSEDLRQAAQESPGSPLRIVCFYEEPPVKERMLKGLTGTESGPPSPLPVDFSEMSPDVGDVHRVAPDVELVLRCPERSGVLTSEVGVEDVEKSIDRSLRPDLSWQQETGGTLAVFAETLSSTDYGGLSRRRDPKYHLRVLLGQEGTSVQFLSRGSGKGKKHDHPSVRSAWDLLTKAGFFPHPFPSYYVSASGSAAGTSAGLGTGGPWYVGAALQRKTSWRDGAGLCDSSRRYVLFLTAVEAGTRRALGYDLRQGEWIPLGRAVARFHGERRRAFHSEKSVRNAIEKAVGSLGPAVLFVEAQDLRRVWSGLQDTTPDDDSVLPSLGPGDALMRVRSTTALEVPQLAGKGEWPRDGRMGPEGKFTSIDALLQRRHPKADEPKLYAASSNHYNNRRNRWLSRFSESLEDLSDPLHSAIATELLCLRTGSFSKRDLYREATTLCRYAPSWTGTLRRPVPLHLAQSIIDDHPLGL